MTEQLSSNPMTAEQKEPPVTYHRIFTSDRFITAKAKASGDFLDTGCRMRVVRFYAEPDGSILALRPIEKDAPVIEGENPIPPGKGNNSDVRFPRTT